MPDYFHDPDTGNTEATITAAALNSSSAVIRVDSVEWSYDTTPTGGAIVLESPAGTAIWKLHVSAAGPGSVQFTNPKRGTAGAAVKVRALAGGGAVKCTVGMTTE